MGYNTVFDGTIVVTPKLNEAEKSFLEDFLELRHTSPDHGPFDLSPGAGSTGNTPQHDKPEIWCNWAADDEGLTWNGADNTYEHDRWLAWLINHLLGPQARAYVDENIEDDPRLASFTCNHVLSGEVTAQGEDSDNMWMIRVENNRVYQLESRVEYYNPIEITEKDPTCPGLIN